MSTSNHSAPAPSAIAAASTSGADAATAKASTKGSTKASAKATSKPAVSPAKTTAMKSLAAAPQKAARSAKATAPGAAVAASDPAANKEGKAKKPKLVRDSFTIPKDEYAAIESLKQRCNSLAQPVKKSELLRAGLKVLNGMSDAALRKAVQAVPSIKTGRPKTEREEPSTPAPPPTSKKSAARA